MDAANPDHPEQLQEVLRVLGEIGASEIPQLLVFNKLDAIEPAQRPLQLQDSFELAGRQVPRVFVSARSGEGLPLLRQQLGALAVAHLTPPGDPAGGATELALPAS